MIRRALLLAGLAVSIDAFGEASRETDCQRSQAVQQAIGLSAVTQVAWKIRAVAGDRFAQLVLGIAGTSTVLRDTQLAQGMQYLEQAAKQGSGFAIGMLVSEFHSMAVSSPESERSAPYGKAAMWARVGAQQGDMDAQRQYAGYLSSGLGVAKDDKAAVHWWRQAADQGSRLSQLDLAKAYLEGKGNEEDANQALIWGTLGARNLTAWVSGSPSLRKVQSEIAAHRAKLSTEQVAFIDGEIKAWLARHESSEKEKANANERECGIREFDKGAIR